MQIVQIPDHDKLKYKELLLLGDEQMSMIERYLWRSDLFALLCDDDAVAITAVTDEGDGNIEIKNLTVRPEMQRKGYGSALISFVKERSSRSRNRAAFSSTTPHRAVQESVSACLVTRPATRAAVRASGPAASSGREASIADSAADSASFPVNEASLPFCIILSSCLSISPRLRRILLPL